MYRSRHFKISRLSAGFLLLPVLLTGGFSAMGEDFPAVDCVITPYVIADISSATPGLIAEVEVDRSDRVEEGQVVARLHAGVEQAVVAYAEKRAKLTTEKQLRQVNEVFDEKRLDRLKLLHSKNVASFQDRDDAQRELALSQWELQRAQDTIELRELELRKAKEQLKEKTVYSPINGFVIQRFKTAGEYVEDQPILRIAQLDPLNVEAIVPMELFGKIKPGMEADVYPEFSETGARRAQISVIDKMGDAGSGTFGVRLTLSNPEQQLPAGLKCQLKFVPGQQQTPDVLPEDPVITKHTAQTKANTPEASSAQTNSDVTANIGIAKTVKPPSPATLPGTWVEVKVRSGDSLARIFSRNNLSAGVLHRITHSSKEAKKLARIKPGKTLRFRLDDEGNLLELIYQKSPMRSVQILPDGESFTLNEIEHELAAHL